MSHRGEYFSCEIGYVASISVSRLCKTGKPPGRKHQKDRDRPDLKRQKSDKMRQPNKNRSRKNNRGNNNNNKNVGNMTNRVFDSSGPEGKVRGTPAQIVEKYQTLARDAQLSGDRVNAENFLQHSEHYARLMAEAQRQIDVQNAKREAEQAERQQREAEQAERAAAQREAEQAERQKREADQPESEPETPTKGEDSNLVDTPEEGAPKPRRTRSRRSNRSGGGDEAQPDSTPDTTAAEA